METAALIFTIVAAAVGATWILAAKLGDMSLSFKEHVASDEARFVKLENKVVPIRGKKRS